MPVSAEMKTYLAGSILLVTVIEIKEVKPDGTYGQIIRITDHTRNLTVGDDVYRSINVLETSQLQQTGDLEPDNLEITSLLTEEFTEEDLRKKKWYGARVTYARYNPLDVSMGAAQRRVCYVGQTDIARYTGKAELRSLSQLLDQPVGPVTSETSRTFLGNPWCKKDLNGQTEQGYEITMQAAVTVVTDRQVFMVDLDGEIATGEDEAPDDFYEEGTATWTSGSNDEQPFKILANTGNEITLWLPTFYDIEVGDTLSLVAGCNRTREMCRDKFNNMVNFRGEPDIPGPDKVFAIPGSPT